MVLLGEEEADAAAVELGEDLVGVLPEVHPERLEAVGGPALRARRAVAVLGHLDARGGAEKGGGGGDVEGVGAVPAGADDFEGLYAWVRHGGRELAHRGCAA